MKEFPQVIVRIDHGRTVHTIAVPEHEVEVLRVVHGYDKVRITGDADADDTLPLSDNADAEMARLQRKYKRINAPDPVRIAFANGSRALKEHGFSLDRGQYQEAPQSSFKKHKKPAPGVLGEAEPGKPEPKAEAKKKDA